MSKEQYSKAREAMEILGDRVFGLIVAHRGHAMQLTSDGGTGWSAITHAYGGDGDEVDVEGHGDSPEEAMDDAFEQVQAIEDPDPDGEEE